MIQNKDFWKVLALVAAGVYVYKYAQERGGTLKGSPFHVNPSKVVDSVMPWVDVHPFVREPLRHGATRFLEKLNGE